MQYLSKMSSQIPLELQLS